MNISKIKEWLKLNRNKVIGVAFILIVLTVAFLSGEKPASVNPKDDKSIESELQSDKSGSKDAVKDSKGNISDKNSSDKDKNNQTTTTSDNNTGVSDNQSTDKNDNVSDNNQNSGETDSDDTKNQGSSANTGNSNGNTADNSSSNVNTGSNTSDNQSQNTNSNSSGASSNTNSGSSQNGNTNSGNSQNGNANNSGNSQNGNANNSGNNQNGNTNSNSGSNSDKNENTCTISISCATILNNMSKLDKDKKDIVPKDGWILKEKTVTFKEGESVFDILQRVCKDNKIHMEASFTPLYNSSYVEGIYNLYEFDCGSLSGWMYSVNGVFPNFGCSQYIVKKGDVIRWQYTCDLGKDVGGGMN